MLDKPYLKNSVATLAAQFAIIGSNVLDHTPGNITKDDLELDVMSYFIFATTSIAKQIGGEHADVLIEAATNQCMEIADSMSEDDARAMLKSVENGMQSGLRVAEKSRKSMADVPDWALN